MTLEIHIGMKRCSEGAHSSPQRRPAGRTVSAAAPAPAPALATAPAPATALAPAPRVPSHCPAVPPRAAVGSKASASGFHRFYAFISSNEPEGSSKASSGSWRRWAT